MSKLFIILEKYFFAFGKTVFLSISLFCVIYPNVVRNVPVEADDSYAYIFKAVQMEQCFFQDCVATKSLLNQIENVSDDKKKEINDRTKEPLFLIYHPLHSLCVLLFHKLKFGWEKSLILTNIFGALILFTGVCMWLRSICNLFAATVGLLVLSCTVFPDQGLHYIVPSNICLGLALIVWSIIISEKKHAAIILAIGSLSMVGMHRIGIIYASLSLALYYVFQIKRKKKLIDLPGIFVVLLIVVALFLPKYVERPFVNADIFVEETGLIEAIKFNLIASIDKIKSWSFIVGFPIIPFIFILFGLRVVKNEKMHIAIYMSILCMAVGVLYYIPNYPGELFSRLSIVFAIAYCGIIGYIVQFCIGVFANNYLFKTNFIANSSFFHFPQKQHLYGFLSCIFLIVILFTAQKTIFVGCNQILSQLCNMITRHNLYLDSAQISYLYKNIKGEKLLFSIGDSVPLLFYLVHGATKNEVLYLELLKAQLNDDNQIDKIVNSFDPKFGVSYNPIHLFVLKQVPKTILEKLGKQRQGILINCENEYIVVKNEGNSSLNNIIITIENQNKIDGEITIDWSENQKELSTKLKIAHGTYSYENIINPTGNNINQIKIRQTIGELPLFVKGIKIGSEVKSNWGWDQGLTINKYFEKSLIQEVSLSSKLFFPGITKQVIVESDSGSIILSSFLL